MTMKRAVSLVVNGEPVAAEVEPRTHLVDFLRDSLGLTGSHLGCEHGVCGACTIEVDGATVRGCITYAAACDGARVRTIEGFVDDPVMAALRRTFSEHHALQCGYCTPGMLITARDIVQRLPDADDARIREELAGNLCRCTGYVGIVAAIRAVLAAPVDHIEARPRQSIDAPALRRETLPRPSSADTPRRTLPDTARPAHGVLLAADADAVWRILGDIETAVRCMPGAELTGPPQRSPLEFRMAAAIGPMRATFEGTAMLDYDEDKRAGSIEGEGRDTRSRSTARGRVEFAVSPSGAGSELTVSLVYSIEGPLAQFSRGAVVDAVVEELVERFAGNVAAAAAGAPVEDAAAAGGVGLALTGLWKRLKRWLSG
jgi:carbon-monoxide dehydrogenase small subunit